MDSGTLPRSPWAGTPLEPRTLLVGATGFEPAFAEAVDPGKQGRECVVSPARSDEPPQSAVGSVFCRTRRLDQFSTVSPLKRAKSLSLVVASTSPCTWAIAAI